MHRTNMAINNNRNMFSVSSSSIYIYLVIISLLISLCSSEVKPTNLTAEESSFIEQFRPLVKDVLYLPFMNEDWYLLQFLKAKQFNVDEASDMLRTAHKWRIQNKIDNILNEDMREMDRNFPYYKDGIDVDGRPVITWNFGKWDIRRIALAGRMDLLQRYTNKILEEGFQLVREQRNKTGKDISQYVLILDGNGYNLRQHACVSCIPFYLNFIQTADQYYPRAARYIHMINIPRAVDQLMMIIKPIMSEQSRNSIRLYGHNKNDWRKEFSQTIPLDQIRPQFGGTKTGMNFEHFAPTFISFI